MKNVDSASGDWRDSLAAMMSSLGPLEDEGVNTDIVEQPSAPAQSRLDIVYERKGRAGKPATIITGFTVSDDEVAALASRLKKSIGTGGSARGGEILVQGDRRQDVLRLLTSWGYKARII